MREAVKWEEDGMSLAIARNRPHLARAAPSSPAGGRGEGWDACFLHFSRLREKVDRPRHQPGTRRMRVVDHNSRWHGVDGEKWRDCSRTGLSPACSGVEKGVCSAISPATHADPAFGRGRLACSGIKERSGFGLQWTLSPIPRHTALTVLARPGWAVPRRGPLAVGELR